MSSFLNRACIGPVIVLFGGVLAAPAYAAGTSYTVLHSFHGAESTPFASLTSDGRGNLYGTTANGGLSRSALLLGRLERRGISFCADPGRLGPPLWNGG